MEVKRYAFEYRHYSNIKELDADDINLLNLAKEAAESAYAPYSAFHVGAAIQLENGIQIKGSNQENAAYPSGLCAERVAIFSASANHPNKRVACIGIFAKDTHRSDDIISPCGSCRQVISEYEHKQDQPIRVLLLNAQGQVWEFGSIEDILPFSFTLKPS